MRFLQSLKSTPCWVARVAPGVVSILLTLPAHALDPDRHLSQYGHFAWRIQDGNFEGSPHAIAQTGDGYIWIGTNSGIFRFDGVAFSPGFPTSLVSPPSTRVLSLLGTKAGALFIGGSLGLWRYQDGRLTDLKIARHVDSVREGVNGDVWVGLTHTGSPLEPICRIVGTDVHCYGAKDGLTCAFGVAIAVDRDGVVWIGNSDGLCRYPPGLPAKYFEQALKHQEGLEGVTAIAISRDGSIFAGFADTGPEEGLQQFDGKAWHGFRVNGMDGSTLAVTTLLVDRDDSLWIGTRSRGLYRVHDGHADHFTTADGLSDDAVNTIFEDREGLIWVATVSGVDVFRNLGVATYSIREGLTNNNVEAVAASPDGTLWIGNGGSLDVIRGGKVTSASQGTEGIRGRNITSLLVDRHGELWAGEDDQLMRYDGRGRFQRVADRMGQGTGIVEAMTEDSSNTLWVNTLRPSRLLRIRGSTIIDAVPIPRDKFIVALAPNADGDMWFGLGKGLARYREGQIQTVSEATGYSKMVRDILVEPDGSVWGTTKDGLLHWANNQTHMLTTSNGLPCNSVWALIEDDAHNLWLSTPCGYVNIAASEILRWLQEPTARIGVRKLDAFDGALNGQGEFRPTAAKSADGRLWFATDSVLQMIDARHLSTNELPPPVHVVKVLADRQPIELRDRVGVPALTRDLEIDYTALSFSVPRKVKFRYKMTGYDADWVDPGARRQAFYSGLAPGFYRFQVIASNNDGVWNESGATIELELHRAWFQTIWFRGLCLLMCGCIIWFIYRLRIRQIAQSINMRFDERLNERTRIARELHDTLLQTIQGSIIVADTALNDRSDDERRRSALSKLSSWLGQALQEGRAALNSLRSTTTLTNDLVEALRVAGGECAANCAMSFEFKITGESRDMHPIVRDEIYRIGFEAIRNACAHSGGTCLEIHLEYLQDFTLSVRDNGKGVLADVAEHGVEGHFGIQGMFERAQRIGGKLSVVGSESGTVVFLEASGRTIYK